MKIYRFKSVDSTMNIAKSILRGEVVLPETVEEVKEGENEVLSKISKRNIIIADEQTAGRGRLDRKWQSDSDKGLYVTYLFSVSADNPNLNGFSLAVGIAVKRAIADLGKQVKLKWPNDLVVFDQAGNLCKLGGILIELEKQAELLYISVGIGLNIKKVNYQNTMYKVCSLEELEGGGEISSRVLFEALTAHFWNVCQTYFEVGFVAFQDEWLAHSVYLGMKIKIVSQAGERFGIMSGIDQAGRLLVADDAGVTTCIEIGDVSLRS
ncbi:MAG: biotin--[acetyl-CoA-carboxylase] ligase [Deltaproteobacteria bacterium]|jgi:BirA family biotin operon repressor/biotin-[acetyl-CoA-carboxylase] ligase|nr:biotin--[acetyl-CoA-carboxylase] ligase [Deltaproteobacteria bacterium]